MTREERMNPERGENWLLQKHLEYIEDTGVSILSVSPKEGDEGFLWTYSIGFWQQYDQPQILIVGLDFGVATAVINHCNQRLKEGETFLPGSACEDILDGYRCYFERIVPEISATGLQEMTGLRQRRVRGGAVHLADHRPALPLATGRFRKASAGYFRLPTSGHTMKNIALLRGINVGGKGLLPMRELVAIFEAAGVSGVQTYIQSGNVVFEHEDAKACVA